MIWLAIMVVASMLACHVIAAWRNANRTFWTLMGFLFGPLAVPFAFFARPTRPRDLRVE